MEDRCVHFLPDQEGTFATFGNHLIALMLCGANRKSESSPGKGLDVRALESLGYVRTRAVLLYGA